VVLVQPNIFYEKFQLKNGMLACNTRKKETKIAGRYPSTILLFTIGFVKDSYSEEKTSKKRRATLPASFPRVRTSPARLYRYISSSCRWDRRINSKFALFVDRPPNLLGCVRLDTRYRSARVNDFSRSSRPALPPSRTASSLGGEGGRTENDILEIMKYH